MSIWLPFVLALFQMWPFPGPGRASSQESLRVDLYVDFESGVADGTNATTTNINPHGTLCSGDWSLENSGNRQKISTDAAGVHNLLIPVNVDGTIYSGTSTRAYRFSPLGDNVTQSVICDLSPGYDNVSFGFDYYSTSNDTFAGIPPDLLSILVGITSSGFGGYVTTHWNKGVIDVNTDSTGTIPYVSAGNPHIWITGSYESGQRMKIWGFNPTTRTLYGYSFSPADGNGNAATAPALQLVFGRHGNEDAIGTGLWYFDNILVCATGFGDYCGPVITPFTPKVNTPTYSQSAGTFEDSVSVTISELVPGASVLYCVDQANSCTPSSSYSSPVTINYTTPGLNYLRSKATLSNWEDSATASAAYTISIVCGASPNCVSGTSTGSVKVGDFSSNRYEAVSFVANGSYTATSVLLRMSKTGSPSNTRSVYIYTDNSGSPGVQVSGGVATFDPATLGTSEGDLTVSGMTAALTNGVTYWIVVGFAGNSATDNINWHYVAGSGTKKIGTLTDNGTWAAGTGSATPKYKINP